MLEIQENVRHGFCPRGAHQHNCHHVESGNKNQHVHGYKFEPHVRYRKYFKKSLKKLACSYTHSRQILTTSNFVMSHISLQLVAQKPERTWGVLMDTNSSSLLKCNLSIYSFNKDLLSAGYLPGFLPGHRDIAVYTSVRCLPSWSLHSSEGDHKLKQSKGQEISGGIFQRGQVFPISMLLTCWAG